MTAAIIVGIVILLLVFLYLRSRPIKNSHKLPQEVEIPEFKDSGNDPRFAGISKGHTLRLERSRGTNGFHLYAHIKTNGKDMEALNKIVISWTEWSERIFNFEFDLPHKDVRVQGDEVLIDLGSFNNCPSSRNFLERTAGATMMKIDLLDHMPEHGDFEYEKNVATQSVFGPFVVQQELVRFRRGLHYLDS